MAKKDSKCPVFYLDSFTAEWNAGTPIKTIREYFPRPDGGFYNERTIRGWAKTAGLGRHPSYHGPIPSPDPQELVDGRIEAERARLDTVAARAEERQLLRQAASLNRVIDAIRDELPRLEPGPFAPFTPSPKEGTLADETVICFISDVQLGEKVERGPTAGLGYYNTEAFHERAERYYQAVTRLVQMHRTMSDIRDLHILFGGDIIEGSSIYASQAFNIDILTVPQVITAVKTFSDMLAEFSSHLGVKIHVYGVPGNHGRIARKGAEPYMNNMDTLVYRMMEMRLENHPGIEWHISDSWFQLIRIKGHLFAVEHGDAVRGSLGIPLYGLIRRHGRLVMTTGQIIDALLIGHHHVPTSAETGFGCRAYINGSWVGTSDFSAHEMGLGSAPSQLLLGVNRHHGIVWERHIHLADKSEIRQLPVVEVPESHE